MSEKSTPSEPGTESGTDTATLERDEPQAAAPTDAQPASPAEKTRFTDRAWGWRAMLAVALAAVILGGLAGAGLAHLAGGGDGRDGRFGPGGRGGPGMGQGPGQGFPGQNGQQGQRGQQNGPGQQNGQQNGQQGSGTASTT